MSSCKEESFFSQKLSYNCDQFESTPVGATAKIKQAYINIELRDYYDEPGYKNFYPITAYACH
jgi:hypothetical protein